ncbi:MAG: helix-turn-helix domain-containing protein [Lachnospiraceae bacterium]|nr:helix-turn-helix domain-containing protein [Lachnospiraceae bacterium]
MTTHAYQEIYLSSAMSSMGEAFDYAVNDCGIAGSSFIKMLAGSSICSRIENGEPAYLAGKSGIEIARECVKSTTGKELDVDPQIHYDRSPEYWCGWAVAYYQWFSSRKYSEIFKAISFEDLLCMYPALHEADVTKFADIVDEKIRETFPDTNLKRLRTAYGCSQSELARLSGVSLSSIQMYEQRQKDINKANVTTVRNLAKTLGCSIEDLIEK